MFEFTALIFADNKQQLVTTTVSHEDELERFLVQRYGIYVCLWYTCNNIRTSYIDGLET